MKKAGKIIVIIGVVFVILGTAAIFGAKIWYSANSEKVSKDYKFESYTESYSDIDSIELSLECADLLIEEGESFSVEYCDIAKGSLSSEVSKGLLKISETRRDVIDLAMFVLGQGRFRPDYEPLIKITLPYDGNIAIISASSSLGDVEMSGVEADEISVTTVSGEAGLFGIKADKLGYISRNGKAQISGEVSGDIVISGGDKSVSVNISGKAEEYGVYIDPVSPIYFCGETYSEAYQSEQADQQKQSVYIKSGKGKIIFNMNEGRENE